MPTSFVIEETPGGNSLVVTASWSDEAEALVASGAVDQLVLNYARGFGESSLEFLDSWPLRGLHVLDRTLTDLTPIARLAMRLQSLSVQAAPKASLDLAALPGLRTFSGQWEIVEATFHGPQALRDVVLIDYDETNLRPLSVQPSISRIVLKGAPTLENLDGVEAFSGLAILRIAAARELEDLSALDAGCDSLAELSFETCLGITSIDHLASLTNLRFLGISDCGRIASLHPVATISGLETLYAWGSTRIEDGDLSPLLLLPSLREVRMRDRREYEPPLDFVRESLR